MSNTLTPEEGQRFAALRMLSAAFPHSKINPDTIRVYMGALADLDSQQLKRAILWTVAHCEFFPTIRALREAALRTTEGGALPGPDEAWGEVVKQMSKIGVWGAPVFSDPAIAQVVDAMGWRAICMSTEAGVVRGQFLKMYATMEKRERETRIALPVDGRSWEAITAVARKMKSLPGGK